MSEHLPVRVFEKQSGLIRLLIYLLTNEPVNIQAVIDRTDIYPNIMFASVKKARALGLISTRLDRSNYPPKNVLTLTEKGKVIAQKFAEINELLTR